VDAASRTIRNRSRTRSSIARRYDNRDNHAHHDFGADNDADHHHADHHHADHDHADHHHADHHHADNDADHHHADHHHADNDADHHHADNDADADHHPVPPSELKSRLEWARNRGACNVSFDRRRILRVALGSK
jgi:hypothetical protein